MTPPRALRATATSSNHPVDHDQPLSKQPTALPRPPRRRAHGSSLTMPGFSAEIHASLYHARWSGVKLTALRGPASSPGPPPPARCLAGLGGAQPSRVLARRDAMGSRLRGPCGARPPAGRPAADTRPGVGGVGPGVAGPPPASAGTDTTLPPAACGSASGPTGSSKHRRARSGCRVAFTLTCPPRFGRFRVVKFVARAARAPSSPHVAFAGGPR